ncbi:MAG: chromate transporter [Bacillota bacterium]
MGAAKTSLMALLAKLALAFMKTGMFTFGSGYAMLAQMQREIVDKYARIPLSETQTWSGGQISPSVE